MRNSLVAGATAGVLVLAGLQAPTATAQSSQVQDGTQSSETQSSAVSYTHLTLPTNREV